MFYSAATRPPASIRLQSPTPTGTSGQSTFTIQTPSTTTPTISALSLTAAQGFDPSTKVYTSGNVASNKYLILYGNFAASDNTVTINGRAVPTGNITYQSVSQINILLGDLTGQTSLNLAVSNTAARPKIRALMSQLLRPQPKNQNSSHYRRAGF